MINPTPHLPQIQVASMTTRNPDYLIEGVVFDCYSPAEKTKVRNVASVIEEKVMQKGQAERVVLNLDDWNGNVDEKVKQEYLKLVDDYFHSIYKQMQKDNVKDIDKIFDFDFTTHTQLSKGR